MQLQMEETLEARIKRLGDERPQAFSSNWHEAAFVYSIIMSQFMTEYFVSGSRSSSLP